MNNTTLEADLWPSLFSDPRNAVAFFPISVFTVTFGNSMIQVLRSYISDNQYSMLTDRMESLFMLIIMVYNVYIFLAELVQLLYPSPSLFVCGLFAVTLRHLYLMAVIVFLQMIILRLLYMTRWKNVGALHDDFFMRFFQITTIVLSSLYSANSVIFGTYKRFPRYSVCIRRLTWMEAKDLDLIPGLLGLIVVLGWVTTIILAKERQKLHNLHQDSRLASGLPRIGETHQSVYQYKTFIMGNALGAGFLVANHFMFWFAKHGTVTIFPFSLAYITCLVFMSFCTSCVYPAVRIWRSEKIWKYCQRKIKGCLFCC